MILRDAPHLILMSVFAIFWASPNRAADESSTATATPIYSPKGGTYSAAQSVSITDATTTASIYYTTNGTTPTTASTKYTGPIEVSKSETVKAIAVASGFTDSAVTSAVYTIEKPAATPVLSPKAGTYTTAQKISIIDAITDATIYYTTDGSIPTVNSARYVAAISVANTETLSAIAIAPGLAPSSVATSTYSILQAVETILHSFGTPNDEAYPGEPIDGSGNPLVSVLPFGLIQAIDGNLYGTTTYGGTACTGFVYSVTPSGKESVIYSFPGALPQECLGGPDGAIIQGSDGNFYGSTFLLGVFKVTPSGTESALTPPFNINDNNYVDPYGALVQGADGNFYGMTSNIVKITPAGVESTFHAFGGPSDGANPSTLILGRDGNLYGMTNEGPPSTNSGTVFEITPSGDETVLYAFPSVDSGAYYSSVSLVEGRDGNLYGVTGDGGGVGLVGSSCLIGCGTFFRLTPGGVYTLLYSFAGSSDGQAPNTLIQATDGNFYGTTASGGAYSAGTFFQVTPSGVETALYSFGHGTDGSIPVGVIQGSDGNFYGVTAGGGEYTLGTVFKITGVIPTTSQSTREYGH